jgi:hypothetical protein
MRPSLKNIDNIIFSRLSRNVIFWALIIFYIASTKEHILQSFVLLTIIFLVSYGIPCYTNNLLLIPKYLVKRKYGLYLLLFGVLWALTTVESYYITQWVNQWFPSCNYMGDLKDSPMPSHAMPAAMFFLFLGTGKFTADAINNQRKLENLEREKLSSELESLKSQINPHFIFNALNTIYGLSRKTSPQAAEATIKLSDILRYILYECNDDKIFLKEELNFIKQYIEFAKLRARPNVKLNFEIDGNTNELQIAPLLLLPLVENAMKHGLAKQIEQPWVNITIHIKDNRLSFVCANSNTSKKNLQLDMSSGIGLKNVYRRLELLYDSKHHIEVNETDVNYSVNLKLELV